MKSTHGRPSTSSDANLSQNDCMVVERETVGAGKSKIILIT